MGIIIDTCIWIEVERGNLSPGDIQAVTGDEPVFLSPVTIAELTFGVEMARSADIRYRRLAALERIKKKPLLIIDEETGVIFGQLASGLRKSGRGADFRIQDIWIASQAVQHGFTILTGNRQDFQDIPGLQLLSLPF